MFEASPSSADCVVSMSGVRKSFGQGSAATQVLRGIDLEIQQGECVFLVGPSGSGKSTLLSILGCLVTPDSGQVEILGQDLGALDNRGRTLLRRDRIGFVFQRFNLLRGLCVLDNVRVPLALRGEPSAWADQRARTLLAAVGMAGKLASDPRQLSAGQCQRVALARALACDPDLILADEPTASLDADSGLAALALLRQLVRQEGKTAIVVTHDSRIFGFADRILHLEHGTISRESTPSFVNSSRECLV